jgi:hypothetical protein
MDSRNLNKRSIRVERAKNLLKKSTGCKGQSCSRQESSSFQGSNLQGGKIDSYLINNKNKKREVIINLIDKIREKYNNFLTGATGVVVSSTGIFMKETNIMDDVSQIVSVLSNFLLGLASLATFIWLMTQSVDRWDNMKTRIRERKRLKEEQYAKKNDTKE